MAASGMLQLELSEFYSYPFSKTCRFRFKQEMVSCALGPLQPRYSADYAEVCQRLEPNCFILLISKTNKAEAEAI